MTQLERPDRPSARYRLSPGLELGPCVLEKPLGRGGMGEVWLARNKELDRPEAIKVIPATSAEQDRARFDREAKAAMEVGDAPEICATYQIAEQGGWIYIRMEYVPGVPLDKAPPLAPERILPLFRTMTQALAAGHRSGVVHRDVKPSNFMLTDPGDVKLLDFGIARFAGDSTVTRTGSVMGTPAFMSLEQWEGAKDVDARTDVYSLGVTFYWLIARRLPFEVADKAQSQAYLAKLLRDDPAPLELPRGLPQGLRNLILRAMAKRRDERFPDADAMLEALLLLEEDPTCVIEAPDSEAVRRRRAWIRRATVLGALLLVTVVAAVAASIVYAGRRSLEEAREALDRSRASLAAAVSTLDGTEASHAPAAEHATRALAAVGEVYIAADRAAAYGRSAADVDSIKAEADAARGYFREVAEGLAALRAKRPQQALEAFAHAAVQRPDESAPKRLGAVVRAEGLLARARSVGTLDVIDALEGARQAAGVIPAAAGPLAAELERLAAETRDRLAADAARLIESGALQDAEQALPRLARFPGGAAEVERLWQELARVRATAKLRAALAAARAAEALGREGRAEAIRGYATAATELKLAGAVRERVERDERVSLAEVEERLRALETVAAGEAQSDEGGRALAQAEAAVESDPERALARAVDALRRLGPDRRAREIAAYAAALLAVRQKAAPAEMVLVPPATVAIGERTDVRVGPFFIDRFETTNEQFRAFVEDGGYARRDLWSGLDRTPADIFRRRGGAAPGPAGWDAPDPFPPERARHPVTGVSLEEARAYAKWRGGRLPTSDEWTVAAGFSPALGRLTRFPWGGEEDPARARLAGKRPLPVDDLAGRDESHLRVVGMGGNVMEWVQDPAGLVRGGSAWGPGKPGEAEVLAARRWTPSRREDSVGFRTVIDVRDPPEVEAVLKEIGR